MEECVICLTNLKTDIVVLHCFHKFHLKCMIKSKRYSQQCPICRLPAITAGRVNFKMKNDIGFYDPYKAKCCTIL